MTTALKAHLADHPTHVVACLDFKNAFGTIDRGTCMKVLRELCPHHPACLDAANVLLAQPALVINPYRNHLAMTYDGLPQGDPLSTLLFSLTMTEVIHKAVRETTSEVKTLSLDDTVLVGLADDIAEVMRTLLRAIANTGLSLQPQKTQLWAPQSDHQITQHPSLKAIQAQTKDLGVSSFWGGVGRGPRRPIPHGQ